MDLKLTDWVFKGGVILSSGTTGKPKKIDQSIETTSGN